MAGFLLWFALALAGWALLSLLVGVAVGRVIRLGGGDTEEPF